MPHPPRETDESEDDEFGGDEPETMSEFDGTITFEVVIAAPEGLTAEEIGHVVEAAEWRFDIQQDVDMTVSLNRPMQVERRNDDDWLITATATVRLDFSSHGCTVYEYAFDWGETATFIRFDVALPEDWEAVEWSLFAY